MRRPLDKMNRSLEAKMSSLPKVGKKYHSKAGNTIEIVQEIEVHDLEGKPEARFTGRPVKTVKGHEELTRKIHVFTREGRWVSPNGLPVIGGSIHDLKEECKE